MEEENISLFKDISDEEKKTLYKLASSDATMVENFTNHTRRSRYILSVVMDKVLMINYVV